jgi:hypothetical protein
MCVRGLLVLLCYSYETLAVYAMQAVYCTEMQGRLVLAADSTQARPLLCAFRQRRR